LFIALQAGAVRADDDDLTELSLESLMEIEVTTVSLRSEKVGETAAAVFVLTRDDIHRAGATNIPDALRLVPGVEVAQINASTWAITIRGANTRYSNKLLVMIDGRSIYGPPLSGVEWGDNQLVLEDVDRIEVVRGPGATLWGANAVNGVINIITRPAQETQGNFAQVAAGSGEFALAEARSGVMLSEHSALRIYAQARNTGASDLSGGQSADDAWRNGLVGFRSDTAFESSDLLVEGGFQYRKSSDLIDVPSLTAPFNTVATNDTDSSAGHILGRWTQRFSDSNALTLSSWLDHRVRHDFRFNEKRTTLDVEMQHVFVPVDGHEVVWGLGYKRVAETLDGGFTFTFTPVTRTTELWSGFVQDTIALVDDKLDLVLGAKIERNDYTGTEVQPNARLLWRPAQGHTLWGAVSYAVRTPSRWENDLRANLRVLPPFSPGNPTGLPLVVSFFGSEEVQAERVTAYEVGYRVQPTSWASFDTAAFYNDYSHLYGAVTGTPFLETTPAPPHLVLPLEARNNETMQSYGFETVGTFDVTQDWRLQGTYGLLKIDSTLDELSGQSPQQQASLRSFYNINDNVNWDMTLRYVDQLPDLQVSSYVELDARIAWRPIHGVELALVGRNLLQRSHLEFGDGNLVLTEPAEVARSVFLSLSVRF